MKKFYKKIIAVLILVALLFVLFVLFVFSYSSSRDYSFDEALFRSAHSSNVTKIYYDKGGNLLNMNSYEAALYEEICLDFGKKPWFSYDEISDTVKNCFISMEDRDFFEHNGVNFKRSIAAFFNYFLHFGRDFGGSTITQQLIKNISGDNERSFKRKFDEMLRAVHIEYSHSKEEIFELYMNVIDMSEGVVGVGGASELYFGKDPSELDYSEAALLVGIANAPSKYNPYNHPEAALEKRNRVLYSLKECGYLKENEYEALKAKELGIIPRNNSKKSSLSWFAETLCSELVDDLSCELEINRSLASKLVFSGGLNIYSTVSPFVQSTLEEYFENNAALFEAKEGNVEFSFVVSDSKSGNLLGVIGSTGVKNADRVLNYATVNNTPGSVLKPLALYAPLIDSGDISWSTVFDDVPLDFIKSDSGDYRLFPKNSPDVYDGLICVGDALKYSKNTVAVRLYSMLGKERIFNDLKEKFGFDELIYKEYDKNGKILSDLAPSPLALGQLTKGVSLRKMTESYNVLANDGVLFKGRSYLSVYDSTGNPLIIKNDVGKRVFSSETSKIMTKMLEGVVDSGTAKRINLKNIVDTAGKTGTSGGDKDRWFVGYTPYYTAGVWCGSKGEKQSLGVLPISHLAVWDEIMTRLHGNIEGELSSFDTNGIQRLSFCMDSGEMFSDKCLLDPRGSRMAMGYFSSKNVPDGLCTRHIICQYDSLSGGIANGGCYEEDIIDISLVEINDRSFPCEITVTDAEYVYRKPEEGIPLGDSYDIPFFYYAIPEGEFVGKSKGRKQYNSSCYIH